MNNFQENINIEDVKSLQEKTGCPRSLCVATLTYANNDIPISIAYCKAKTLAVATPGMNFDERVNFFI